jgi:hypothetical protein
MEVMMAADTLDFEAATSLIDRLVDRLISAGRQKTEADRLLIKEAQGFLQRHKRMGAKAQ